jgi:hypothetical protein
VNEHGQVSRVSRRNKRLKLLHVRRYPGEAVIHGLDANRAIICDAADDGFRRLLRGAGQRSGKRRPGLRVGKTGKPDVPQLMVHAHRGGAEVGVRAKLQGVPARYPVPAPHEVEDGGEADIEVALRVLRERFGHDVRICGGVRGRHGCGEAR